MTTPEPSRQKMSKVVRIYPHGEESMLIFDAAQQEIEETRQLLNDVARQSAQQGRTPE